jgi:dolichol-phosphate mannosyltransferase
METSGKSVARTPATAEPESPLGREPRIPGSRSDRARRWFPRHEAGLEPNGAGSGPEYQVSVVVPTRNEVDNVKPLVDLIADALIGELTAEVIFVDDSDDSTPDAVERLRSRDGLAIRLIHRPPNERAGGLGSAVVAGIAAAEAPYVCVMDADLQHPPATIRDLYDQAVSQSSDLVVASRFHRAGDLGEFGPLRTAVSRASAGAARLMFPSKLRGVSDPMSGFFMVRREAIDVERMSPRGFKILLETLVRTPGLRVSEVPFTFGSRHAGKTKASAREGARFALHLWELRARAVADRVGRFALVGVSGLLVNTALLALLVELTQINYLLGAVIATQGSTAWNFIWSERLVFADRKQALQHRTAHRLAMFFVLNNSAHLLRIPLLALLVSSFGIQYLVANVISLLAIFVARFIFSNSMIWAPLNAARWNYDIHGIVTIESDGRLPELEAFRVAEGFEEPTIRVRLGHVNREAEVEPATGVHTHIAYSEWRGVGFSIEMDLGEDRAELTASPWLRRSPHVLYTNVVEPVIRWTMVRKGYALVHGACLAEDGRAFLITARTDTGKTTTILKTLDAHPHAFVSDDFTIVGPQGQVLTYPKPLTISRHTLHAVKTPLLSRKERTGLVIQSRLHSKSGRLFGMLLARLRLPAATMNGLVQWVVPPPKFHIDRLVPGVEIASEAQLAGMAVIQRGGTGDATMDPGEALKTLMENCEDAYGFPPYPVIEEQLHSGNGEDLRSRERDIVSKALGGLSTTLMRSENMDWAERLPDLLDGTMLANGNGSATAGLSGNGANGDGHPATSNGERPSQATAGSPVHAR